MKKKTIAGLIAIVAIVAAVIFAGCIEEETPVSIPTPTPVSPTSSFEIEYPVTAYFGTVQGTSQVTLYEDGTAFGKMEVLADEALAAFFYYGEWEIMEKTTSKIEYRLKLNFTTGGPTGSGTMHFALFSDHAAVVDPGFKAHETPGYWSE